VVVHRDERSDEYPRYSKRAIDNYRAMGLGDSMIEYLDVIYGLDPDWCELFMQYTRAGMYSREVVPQSTREIVACAVLACLDKQAQLRQHLVGAVAAGATKEQALEAVFQSVTYGGFPAVMSSIRTYAEVFPEMVKRDRPIIPASEGESPMGPRFPLAVETATRLWGEEHVESMFGRYDRWDPSYSMLCQVWTHGGVYARTVLTPELRELVAIGCLAARNALPQLETHLVVGFRLGIPRVEMQEIILQMTVYVGNPYVMQAMAVFERVANAVEQTSASAAV
jgi:4-carboxymuconolactone decarboxylase